MERITSEPQIQEIKSINDLIFQHHSPHEFSIIEPQTYTSLKQSRIDDLGDDIETYIDDRKYQENKYRKKLKIKDNNLTFTYATIVGFNKMESALDYPGFTYYFKLNKNQIENCLFGIISKDFVTIPQKGMIGLRRAINNWQTFVKNLSLIDDDILEFIEPRIEVIIPFDVYPNSYIPQVEDR